MYDKYICMYRKTIVQVTSVELTHVCLTYPWESVDCCQNLKFTAPFLGVNELLLHNCFVTVLLMPKLHNYQEDLVSGGCYKCTATYIMQWS